MTELRYIIATFLVLFLVSCQSGLTKTVTLVGLDVGITSLLDKGKLKVADAKAIQTTIDSLLKDKDLTVLLYNEKVSKELSKYPAANILAEHLIIKVEGKITPETKALIAKILKTINMSITRWEKK